jgi:hypothetical protein
LAIRDPTRSQQLSGSSVENLGMPTHQTVESFVGLVEGGNGIEALNRFYAENASMRENQAQPRIGKAALLAREIAAQASVRHMSARAFVRS